MRILFIGDIFGSPGRKAVSDHLRDIVQRREIDLVLANGENVAGGFGITPSLANELFGLGIEAMSTGNHVWDKKEILEYFAREPRLVRAANFPPGAPGRGVFTGRTKKGVEYALLHLMGRVFRHPLDCPFRKADEDLSRLPASCKIRVVDIHAEATSEKQAMGWHLNGRATAVIGTHTHVPTADERILSGGTAFITDVGMTGPYDSVIGVEKEIALSKFIRQMPNRFEPAKDDVRIAGVIIDADEETGRARSVERFEMKIT